MNIHDILGIILPFVSGAIGIGVGWGILRTRVDHIQKRVDTHDGMIDSKLSEKAHMLICQNAGLIAAQMVEVKLKERHEEDKREMKEMKEELLKAIRVNGRGG